MIPNERKVCTSTEISYDSFRILIIYSVDVKYFQYSLKILAFEKAHSSLFPLCCFTVWRSITIMMTFFNLYSKADRFPLLKCIKCDKHCGTLMHFKQIMDGLFSIYGLFEMINSSSRSNSFRVVL